MEQMEPSIIAMLNSIYRAAPAGIGMVRNRVFCQVNDRVCEMTGYSRQELIGQSSRMVYPSQEEYEKVGRYKYEQVRRLGVGTVETRWQRKDGTIIDILLSSAPLNINDLSEGVIFTAMDTTERKRAEAALQESEARRRTLIETTATGYLILDERGKVIDANAEYIRLAGYHRLEEIRGRSILEWTAEYEKKKNAEAVAQCLRDGYVRNFEIDYVDPQGKITPVEINATVERKGNVRLILTLCRDITERKRVRKELDQTRALLMTAVEQSPSGILIADAPDVRIRVVNSAALGIRGKTGIPLTEIDFAEHSKNWHTYYPDGITPYPPEKLPLSRAILEGVVSTDVEAVISSDQGERRWVSANAGPIRDKEGRITAGIVVFHDITERKQAEKTLRESEQRFRRIVEASPMGMHLYELRDDGDLVLIDANAAADHFTGTHTADLLNLPIERAFPGLVGTDIPRRYKEVALGQAPAFELRDLEYHDPHIHGIFDVYLFQSSPGRMVAMFQEVTERQRAEQQREQLLKALQAKTEELESIIYVSSHDLRSPLVNIQGFSGELGESCRQVRKLLSGDAMSVSDHRQLEELLGQDIPSAIEYITTSVSKLDALQKGLLKICRIGRESLEIALVAMNELIDSVLKSTRYQLDNCQAQVIVDPLPNCLADAAQLTQVFTNLIDNAIKYRSRERPLVIRIYGRVEGTQCVYAIADNGVGIAPEHQQKVFEMFHQLDPLNGSGGEGLGLTIVKRILGHMDGQVRLESAPGVGSVFTVLLPKA